MNIYIFFLGTFSTDGSKCQPCLRCDKGYGEIEACRPDNDVICDALPCRNGHFSVDGITCIASTICGPGFEELSPVTSTRDR